MTDAEWRECDDLMPMLEFLQAKGSDRKLRLFSCACCRRIWDRLVESERAFVEAAERIVDGVGTPPDADAVGEMVGNWHTPTTPAGRALGCLFYGRRSRTPVQIKWFLYGRNPCGPLAEAASAEVAAQCALLRDVVGNPFRPVTLDSRWQSTTVLDLARTIYDQRTFENMPILADALMDAGCDNAEIIEHCQGPGPHVRGCWVVDLLLAME